MMIKQLINILFVFGVFILNAQNPVFKIYNSTNGLFSTSTNCVVQDNDGIIWIGTKNGIIKFDGYTFKNYTIEEGLVDNNIVDCYKDNKGVIWFISSNYNIGYVKNDSIIEFEYNSTIMNELYLNEKYIKKSLSVKYGVIKFAVNNIGLFVIDSVGVLKKYYTKELLNGNAILINNNKNAYIIDSYFDKDTLLFSNRCIYDKKHIVLSENKLSSRFVVSKKGNYYYMSEGNKLIILKNRKIINSIKLDSKIILITTIGNTMWVSTKTKGIFMFNIADGNLKLISNYFEDYIINYIFKDIEGGLWFSTLNRGLLYVPDLNTQQISISKNKKSIITDFNIINNSIYLAYSNGDVENINIGTIIKLSNKDIYDEVKLSSNSRYIYALFDNKIFNITKNKAKLIIDIEKYSNNSAFNNIFVDNRNMIWVSNKNKIIKINTSVIENIFTVDENIHSEITNILKSPEGLFISVKKGFWKFNNNSYYNYTKTSDIFNTDITSISTDRYGFTTLLSTNGKGLIILAKNSVFVLNKSKGLFSNVVTTACFMDSILVIGTNKNVEVLTVDNKFKIIKHKIYKGNYSNISNQVNKIIRIDEKIYYTTNNNFYRIIINGNETNKYLPNVIIKNIRINNNDTIFSSKKVKLKSFENNLIFNFLGISYKNVGNVNYRYKLVGKKDNWQYTKSTSVDYSFLPYGKHKFVVCASNIDGLWGKPTEFSFVIERPLYLKWWFLSLSVLVFLLIVFIVGKAVLNNIKRKESMKKDMIMYRQQALRKQMNPHFIFNSLNSIQHFILQNDKKMSNKYLNRFSKLIRIVLENSQKNLISIDEELAAIEFYLEIEELRFKNKFTYTINISNEIDTANSKIPPLLLQPFLENSIWHGLMNINDERKGELIFSMNKIENNILCIIEDNGVGRYKAKEIKDRSKRDYKSLASVITNERVELFNYENNKKIIMRYIDKYSSENIAEGTKVEITIPIIY